MRVPARRGLNGLRFVVFCLGFQIRWTSAVLTQTGPSTQVSISNFEERGIRGGQSRYGSSWRSSEVVVQGSRAERWGCALRPVRPVGWHGGRLTEKARSISLATASSKIAGCMTSCGRRGFEKQDIVGAGEGKGLEKLVLRIAELG